jgi:uncharacterized membrane protein YhiD involved in acid resistance
MTNIPAPQARIQRKAAVWIAIGLGLLFLVAANGHLVYVAVMSQPACVDHVRLGDPDNAQNRFRAAKSSCSPR